MPQFTYEGIAAITGQRKHGTLTAASRAEAEKLVQAKFPAGSGEISVILRDYEPNAMYTSWEDFKNRDFPPPSAEIEKPSKS
ncbi:MAG: hypothetical protein LBJ37_21510 [Paucimonas sp.]|jgi:hypothetical protein|nr:hypothetical protein [Paucimonas sp.]